MKPIALPLIAALCLVAADPQDTKLNWHNQLSNGKKAAARSGRPIFLVTMWKTGV